MNDVSKAKLDADGSAGPTPIPGLSGQAKLAKPLEQGRIKLIRASESDIGDVFAAILPAGTPFESALAPGYWSNGAARMHVGDQIEIRCDDQTYFGRVLVRNLSGAASGKQHTRADVARLEFHEFDRPSTEDSSPTHKIEHKGPHLKHCVVRLSDEKIVSDGHVTKEAAQAAMAGILRAA